LNVKLSFPFEGFGELQYMATLQVASTSSRAVLIRYHLFDNAELLTPWNQPTEAWDTYVDAMLDIIRRRDRDAILRNYAPPEDDRRWFATNRTSIEYREDALEDLFDEYWDESLGNSIDELFEEVFSAIPDADRMQLVRYAPMTDEYGEDGVMLSVKTPSVPHAVFAFAAMQGPDKFYYFPHGTSVTTDEDDMEEDAWVLSFVLYPGTEESMAEVYANKRARDEMRAECPGFDEASDDARQPVMREARRARRVLKGGDTVLACRHAEELLGFTIRRLLAGRGAAFLWLATDAESDLGADSVATYLRNAIDTYAAALKIVEDSERMDRAAADRYSKEYRAQIVRAAEVAFSAGHEAQSAGLEEASFEFFTAAAVGSFFLDPSKPAHKRIRSYSGYVVGGSALNDQRVDEARKFLPLVVPPDPALLEATDADLTEALFLEAKPSANLYFNLGAMTFNEAYARYEQQSTSANPDYADLVSLLEEARIALTLAKRLDPELANVDAVAAEVDSLAGIIANWDG
jgi:hypothetical protein